MHEERKISRRTAGGLILSAAAAASLTPVTVGAQPVRSRDKDKDKDKQQTEDKSKKGAAPTLDYTRLVKVDKAHDWTLKGEINVNAWVESPRAKDQQYVVHELVFDSAAVVFPILKGSASHRAFDGELKSKLQFNDAIISEKPDELVDRGFPCGTRLGRWDMKSPSGKQFRGRNMKLEVEISMSSWRTVFEEEAAGHVPWPTGNWDGVAASTFTDLQRVGDINLVDHTTEGIQTLVRGWCGGKDPKGVAPVPLAKWLASNVLEYVQPSGNGLNFAKNGMLEGMELKGSELTLADRRGSDQDITCALAAVYRAAGLPSRTVIGFDVSDDKGDDGTFLKRRRDVPAFRSWVEFCLYDEKTRREVWVPVDITRQRRKSSRAVRNMDVWSYFGSNDELDTVCPIAFQFHPPTSVVAHGSVCFWGWITFGTEQPKAQQHVRFDAMSTARTTSTEKNRRLQDEQQSQPPKRPTRK
jgi:hypothetical protein